MLTKVRLATKVWAIEGETQAEIGKAFIRFQEFYENPVLKGRKDITVPMIESWWKEHRKKEQITDSYYEYWVGFNIPGRVFAQLIINPDFRPAPSLTDFFRPRFKRQEDQLLSLIADIPLEELVESYLIGYSTHRNDVVDHELAHAFFSTNRMYKSSQMYNIARLPTPVFDGLRNELVEWGYHPDVVHDEIQAYMSTYVSTLATTFTTPDIDKYTQPFVDTFNTFREIEDKQLADLSPHNSAD